MQYYEKGDRPSVIMAEDFDTAKAKKQITDEKEWQRLVEFVERLSKNAVTYQVHTYGEPNRLELVNFALSRCYSCNGFAVWVMDNLIYPAMTSDIRPHDEMPVGVREAFEEAAAIVDRSPRGAAALLRLAVQMLMPLVGETGKDLNADIASLVKKGLETEVQQALDVVRVIGNHAVHPGLIDLKDDKATAITLFGLVNMIVDRRIAAPKRIGALFEGLPPRALEAIANRDNSNG